jgi:transcriptional regulator with XRE-family HTH domain
MKFKLSREEMKQIAAGDEIRHSRNEVCLTQEYMAKKLGLSQSTYQRIETGEINISLERLIQIAEILQKPLDYFLKEKEHIETLSNSNKLIYVNQREWELTQKIILQQEKRIEELEKKLNKGL